MGVLSVLLFPFAVIFRIATGIRNHLYTIGHKRSFQFEVPVINVGNLNIGGSGKTPAIEYLIRLLKKEQSIATLSRGYGRRTRGLRFASASDNASTLGDEPYQFFKNFGDEVKVVVGEDRAFAIPNILHEYPDTSLVLLDDAYQHRRVKPHFNILLTDCEKPFYIDHLLPMGRLRESRKEAERCDMVVVTKCAESLDDNKQKEIERHVREYAGNKPVFFSYISYGHPKAFLQTKSEITPKVVLVSGIAKSKPLEEFVKKHFDLIRHFQFRDHHLYTSKEVSAICDFMQHQEQPVSLLTTEKDMVRFLDPKFGLRLNTVNCFFLPIEMKFIRNGAEFDALVRDAVEMAAIGPKSVEE